MDHISLSLHVHADLNSRLHGAFSHLRPGFWHNSTSLHTNRHLVLLWTIRCRWHTRADWWRQRWLLQGTSKLSLRHLSLYSTTVHWGERLGFKMTWSTHVVVLDRWCVWCVQIRTFSPCAADGDCNWVETTTPLQNGRWYATNQRLPDGSQVVVGGRSTSTLEYVPANGAPLFLDLISNVRRRREAAAAHPPLQSPLVLVLRFLVLVLLH